MQIIAKAKVPIVKFTEVESGFNFDISLDVANGPDAAEIVLKLMQALPPMKPLVLVLKMFLQQRQLNEARCPASKLAQRTMHRSMSVLCL